MLRYLFASATLLLSLLTGSCGSGATPVSMYVLVTPATASRFMNDLALIARDQGLSSSAARATDDQGHTLHVLEAKGRGIRVWSQNLPLSGHEDAAICGRHGEAYPDPGQFILTVESRLPFLHEKTPIEVATKLRKDLLRLGYQVLQKLVTCSSLARSVRNDLGQAPLKVEGSRMPIVHVLADGEQCVIGDKKMRCDAVGPYLRDTLRIAQDLLIRVFVDGTQRSEERGRQVRRLIRSAGYTRIITVGFITEPTKNSGPGPAS